MASKKHAQKVDLCVIPRLSSLGRRSPFVPASPLVTPGPLISVFFALTSCHPKGLVPTMLFRSEPESSPWPSQMSP